MAGPTPEELLHDRLRAFLLHLKPVILGGAVDQDRLAQLRRLSDVRIRQFALTKPQITGIDLCGLLSDPRSGRFDDLADEAGVLRKGHLSIVLPTLGEDMGYLIEACLTLQVLGLPGMKDQARSFAAKAGFLSAPAGGPAAQAPKPPAAPLPPGVARLLAGLKDLWSLSPSTLKALELLRAADSPADQVCAEIERDPALAAQALRLINASPAEKASSVKRAVVALGYPLARRFVMSAALTLKLAPPYPAAGFDARAFWLRSLQVAHAAALVSRNSKLGSPDEHYSAGLLHAVGRLAAAKAGGDAPAPQVGAAILERWRFPAAVVEAARHHEDTADQLEELQIPREAMVVTALHGTLSGTPDVRTWAGFLRIAADSVPGLLDAALKSAQPGADGLGA